MPRCLLPLLPLLLLAAPCLAQVKPSRESTKEERERLLETVESLEKAPLGDKADENRRWAVTFLIVASDIKVEVGNVVMAVTKPIADKKYQGMFGMHFIIACGADVVRNDGKQDILRTNTNAVKSCLTMYKSLIKDHPERKIDAMEELLKKNDKGLRAFVEENLKRRTQ
jgi:hypothetical protein